MSVWIRVYVCLCLSICVCLFVAVCVWACQSVGKSGFKLSDDGIDLIRELTEG